MTVENWVYDQKIDVDVTNLYAFGEEVIPDEELSDANSPVVALVGHDITQGYTINQNMYNEDFGKWTENLQATITPQSDVSLRSIKLLFTSDNATLLNDLSAAGYTNNTVQIWPQNSALTSYLLIQDESGVVKATLKDAGMTKLFTYKGVHTVKFIAVDSKGRTSYTNLKITVSEGGSIVTEGPTATWVNDRGGQLDVPFQLDPNDLPPVELKVESKTGITDFKIEISSTNPEFAGLVTTMFSTTSLDLINPGSNSATLSSLGFPTGDQVRNQTSLSFDISKFMSALAVFSGEHTFKLQVTDANGQIAKSLILIVK